MSCLIVLTNDRFSKDVIMLSEIFKTESIVENQLISGKKFQGIVISGCLLSFSRFYDITFQSCVFFADRVENCVFVNCKFVDCKFQFTIFEHCRFDSSIFEHCSWESSRIKKTTIADCVMDSRVSEEIAA